MNGTLVKRTALETSALIAALTISLQGCSVLGCDNYVSYDDILDSWVGADLNDYERRTDNRPVSSMERPANRMEYAFNTPYYDYDGKQRYCRTWLDVARSSGEIVGWRYEGDCYMHSRCGD